MHGINSMAVAAALVVAGAGCTAAQEDPALRTGAFVDGAVANLTYRTETQSGVTNAAGEFQYYDGEQVTFSIGALEFPAGAATPVVTPLTLFGTADTSDPAVVNMARLLVSLDEDGDATNGIQIPAGAAAAAAALDFDQPVDDFAALPAVGYLLSNAGGGSATLVSEAEAIAHLDRFTGIVGTWHCDEGTLTLTAGGSFTYTEFDAELPNGTESGTYQFDPALSSITFSVTYTTNYRVHAAGIEWGGICEAGPGVYTYPAVLQEDGTLYFADAMTMHRTAWTDDIEGTWAPVGGGLEGVFTFFPDGRFEYIEIDGVYPDGTQAGTFDFDPVAQTIVFDVDVDEMPGDGITGIAPPYEYSALLTEDALLIDGSLSLVRQ